MTARALLALLVLPTLFACSDPADSAAPDLGVTRSPETSAAATPARTELAEVEAAPPAPARTEVQAAPRAVAKVDTVVTVVDPGGAPVVGVPVVGCEVDDEGRPKGRVRWTFAVETDARGEATVPARRVGPRFAAALFGRAAALSTEDDPYRIVLPECGALEFDLTALTAKARVRIAPNEKRRKPERFDVAAGAKLLVERVPLGESFKVQIQSDAGRASLDVDGPTVASQTITVRPDFEKKFELRAVFVDEDGAPIARASVLASQDEDEDSPVLNLPPSAPDGSVSKHVRRTRFFTVPGGLVTFEEYSIASGAPTLGRSGTAELPAPTSDGVHDFGEIVLKLPPIVAAGVVRGADGEAIAAANLSVETIGYVDDEQLESLGLEELEDLMYESGLSRTNGRFEIRHAYPEALRGRPGLVLSVGVPDVTGGLYVPFELGAEDLEIEIEPAGTLFVDGSGLDPAVWSQLEFDASPTFVEGEPVRIDEYQNMMDGELARDPFGPRTWGELLVPGTYDVSVSLGWFSVARVEGVVVPPGERSDDARLAPLVLDRAYSPRTVVVQRADGTPIAGAKLVYGDATDGTLRDILEDLEKLVDESPETAAEFEELEYYDYMVWSSPVGKPSGRDGRMTLLTSDDTTFAVAIFADGYLGADVTNVADGEAVVLEPLVDVTLVFELGAEGGEIPKYGGALEIRPFGSNVIWDESVDVEFESAPHERTVQLAAGAEFWVDADAGESSPWWRKRFTVPEGGGRVVLVGSAGASDD